MKFGKLLGRFFYKLLIYLLLGVFLFSAYQIYRYVRISLQSENLRDQLVEQAVQLRPSPEESPEELEQAPISVDFEALQQESEDIIAWLYCEDTQINYPVVQAADNEYYLDKLPDGQWNSGGSLFLDYRNAADFSDRNSLIYGHNMKNLSMFGSISKYKEQAYYEAHPLLWLLTPEGDYKVELLAGYVAEHDAEVYSFPLTEDTLPVLLEQSLARSNFKSEVELQPGERLLTLSTCSYEYDNARYVLIGVLRPLPGVERPTVTEPAGEEAGVERPTVTEPAWEGATPETPTEEDLSGI
ncbi:MAG: class B sortase [Firmicutes bacterium]|nr:class B sortase [Bacillota bacterium]